MFNLFLVDEHVHTPEEVVVFARLKIEHFRYIYSYLFKDEPPPAAAITVFDIQYCTAFI